MKKSITIQLDRKEQILDMFQRHLIVQKPKIVDVSKKKYKRERYREEE